MMNGNLRRVLSYGFAIALLVSLIYLIDAEKFVETITGINKAWIVPAIGLYSIDWVLRGYKWKIIVESDGTYISSRESLRTTLLCNAANAFLPAKLGDSLRVIDAKSRDKNYTSGTTLAIASRFFDFLAVLVIASFSLMFLDVFKLPWYFQYVIAASYAIIAAIIMASVLERRLELARFLRYDAMEKHYELFKSEIATLKKSGSLRSIVAVSLLIWLLETGVTIIFARSLGVSIPVTTIVFAVLAANLTKALPLTPGSIGFYEGAMTSLLVVFGLSPATAFSIAVLDHMFKTIYIVVIGALVLIQGGSDYRFIYNYSKSVLQ